MNPHDYTRLTQEKIATKGSYVFFVFSWIFVPSWLKAY
jgi:hypothetical protein